jgi:hypothetical protein
MLALGFERFNLVQIGSIHVAIVVSVLEFRKGVVVRGNFHSFVIYLDFLQGFIVIIEDHSLGADKGHPSDFIRIEPAALNRRKPSIGKIEGHVGYTLHARMHVLLALTIYRGRSMTHDKENNGNVWGARSHATLMSF